MMKTHPPIRIVLVLAIALGISFPALAQVDGEDPPDRVTGKDRAVQKINENLLRQWMHLGEQLSRVPEQAHPGILNARDSMAAGMKKALMALGAPPVELPVDSGDLVTTAPDDNGFSDVSLKKGTDGITRPEKPSRPGRPDRPEKPQRPEKPERPDKPNKP